MRAARGQFYLVLVVNSMSQLVEQRNYFNHKEDADAFAAKMEAEGFTAHVTQIESPK